MIMVFKKSNIIFVTAIFLLSLVLIGINSVFLTNSTNANDPNQIASGDAGKGRTVVLDPGHGGEDPGAVSDSGILEKEINLNIAMEVKRLLEADGYTVLMTRTEDTLIYDDTATGETAMRKQDLERRKRMMDESGADIVISIHMNKFPDASVRGAQTFFTKESPDSQRLAKAIQQSIVDNADPNNRRAALVKRDDVIITKNVQTTTIIVEGGFLSNPEEEQLLSNTEYQNKLANAIKLGIDTFFQQATPSSEQTSPPPSAT